MTERAEPIRISKFLSATSAFFRTLRKKATAGSSKPENLTDEPRFAPVVAAVAAIPPRQFLSGTAPTTSSDC